MAHPVDNTYANTKGLVLCHLQYTQRSESHTNGDRIKYGFHVSACLRCSTSRSVLFCLAARSRFAGWRFVHIACSSTIFFPVFLFRISKQCSRRGSVRSVRTPWRIGCWGGFPHYLAWQIGASSVSHRFGAKPTIDERQTLTLKQTCPPPIDCVSL